MILGLSTAAFTAVHVAISLLGLVSGLVAVGGLARDRGLKAWTAVFLAATVATSATGFAFHSRAIGPPHVVGALSLAVLALALWALYGARLRGAWRGVYVVCAAAALYFNAFVAVVQAFQKIGPLHALAPHGAEPPFLAAQLLTLAGFTALGVVAWRRFRSPDALAPA